MSKSYNMPAGAWFLPGQCQAHRAWRDQELLTTASSSRSRSLYHRPARVPGKNLQICAIYQKARSPGEGLSQRVGGCQAAGTMFAGAAPERYRSLDRSSFPNCWKRRRGRLAGIGFGPLEKATCGSPWWEEQRIRQATRASASF